ncbi:MAG: hypothetical protein Q9176_007119 [Flavoplaca citrina]
MRHVPPPKEQLVVLSIGNVSTTASATSKPNIISAATHARIRLGNRTCVRACVLTSLTFDVCTLDNRDSGNQAVQQCSNKGGQYCCDQNRDASNVCCNRNDDSIFFNLPRGNPTATIKSLDGPAEAQGSGNSNAGNSGNGAGNGNGNSGNGGNGAGNGNNNAGNNGNGNGNGGNNSGNNSDNENENEPDENEPDENENSPPSNSQKPPNPATTISRPPNPATTDLTTSTPPPTTTTQTRSSTSSAPNGATSLILITSTIASTPTPTTLPLPASDPPSPSPSSSTSTNAATIGGATAGGVVALLLLALLAFLLRRRRKQKRAREIQNATVAPRRDYLADADKEGGMEYMYRNSGHGGWTGDTLQGSGESPEIDGVEVGRGVRGGGVRPGEKTRVGRKGDAGGGDGVNGMGAAGGGKAEVGGGQGLGLERQDVVELPAGDIPNRAVEQPGQLDGTAVDKWRAYEIAAKKGR